MGTMLLVASGKGGTGKTSFSAGVALALASLGEKVLLIDADAGMRNLDIVLGMAEAAMFSFSDVALSAVSLAEAAVPCPAAKNLYLLTAPVSPDPDEVPETALAGLCDAAKEQFSWIMIDCPAGLGGYIFRFAEHADQAAVIATADNVSLRGAERMASELFSAGMEKIRLVINRVRPKLMRQGLTWNVDDAMDFAGLPLLGVVPEDERVIISSACGAPLLSGPERSAVHGYRNIAGRLLGQRIPLIRL